MTVTSSLDIMVEGWRADAGGYYDLVAVESEGQFSFQLNFKENILEVVFISVTNRKIDYYLFDISGKVVYQSII